MSITKQAQHYGDFMYAQKVSSILIGNVRGLDKMPWLDDISSSSYF